MQWGDADPCRGPSLAVLVVLCRRARAILADRDRLVRDLLYFHPGLRLFVISRTVCDGGRYQRFPRPQRQAPMGPDVDRVRDQPCAGAIAARILRLRAAERAAAALPDDRRADQRRLPICFRQAVRTYQAVARDKPIKDRRRPGRRRTDRGAHWCGTLRHHAVLAVASRGYERGHRHRWVLWRLCPVGDQARSRRKRLGQNDRGPWRDPRSHGLGVVRLAAVLSSDALLFRDMTDGCVRIANPRRSFPGASLPGPI